jgi:signal transduction histidine kinase
MLPSLFPIYDPQGSTLRDGSLVPITKFCKNAFLTKEECARHYEVLASSPSGYYQCPFGLTSRSFEFENRKLVTTGVVAFPRFNTSEERRLAKLYPDIKVARRTIEDSISFFALLEQHRADVIEEASKVLPQAFHELRKLNGAILQHAESEINERGESRNLKSIKAAAEFMRNNFDILEALSNIEGIKALPNDSTINLFDLVFKVKKIFQEKTDAKGMSIHLFGERPIIVGSWKSFQIIPAVLLENAIKYGKKNTNIRAETSAANGLATLCVENQTEGSIDPDRCFDRGVRFSQGVEGGGFGLFLAREVVTCHHGKIRCESSKGIVRMIVELPLHKTIAHSF